MSRRGVLAELGWATLLAGTICAPLLVSTGFWLVGDMVFVPRQPWKPEWLGLDGSLPRAVPGDAVISGLTMLIPGWLVQRLFLVGGLVVAALGAARLVGERRWFARWAAMTLWIWNPWVFDRLMIGQWAILLGCLLLPWVVLAARRAAQGEWAWLYLVLLLCAVASPAPGAIAGLLAVALAFGSGWRHVLVTLALATVANAVWVAPALLATAQIPAGGAGFAGFAPRAESEAGVMASLISTGGIWKSSIVAGERQVALVVLVSAVFCAAAYAVGVWHALRRWRGAPGPGLRTEPIVLAALGALALGYVALSATETGQQWLSIVGENPILAPALNMFRDSHRLLALWLLALLPGTALATESVARWITPGREAIAVVVAALVLTPVLLLPSLAVGGLGRLQTAHYPEEWNVVAEMVREQPGPMIVLPWHGSYRGFDFNHRTAVLDPAPRFFPGEVLIDDRVFLGTTQSIGAEDPRRARISQVMEMDDPTEQSRELAQLGIRWVLLEKGMVELSAPQGEVRHAGSSLELVELPAAPQKLVGLRSNSVRILIASYVTSVVGLLLSLGWLVSRITAGDVDRTRTIVRTERNRRKDEL